MPITLQFWNKWFKSSPYGVYDQILDLVLNEAVLWCTVVILITSTACIMGFQLGSQLAQKPEPDQDQTPLLLALLWQALLQLLVNYCTVVPVLREQRQRKKSSFHPGHDVIIRVHYTVFYGCVVASVVATVLAPVLLAVCPLKSPASTIANFTSNIFSAIVASQLAAGLTNGLRRRAIQTAQRHCLDHESRTKLEEEMADKWKMVMDEHNRPLYDVDLDSSTSVSILGTKQPAALRTVKAGWASLS